MARFIATSINLPKVDNTAITKIRSGTKLYSICEFQGMHNAYFYWQVEFNDAFPIRVKGLNRPQIDITPWDGKEYRIRLFVTYRGENIYFEADHLVAESESFEAQDLEVADSGVAVVLGPDVLNTGVEELAETTTTSSDTFNFNSRDEEALILTAAAVFRKNQNQDLAHNAILTFLLKSVSTLQEGHEPAYEAMKRGLNHPLHHVRKSSGLSKVKNSDFFIRDFLMLHTQGGESAGDPIMLKNISIFDGAVDSDFSYEFNLLVDQINERNEEAGLRHDVKYFDQLAHRDGLQLIPKSASVNQFMGATMSHVTLRSNTIESQGALQGIFASDGSFRNLHIINNRISTAGAHTIAIAGMLSGKISGNYITAADAGPSPKATLYPLRIGGGANIKVLSFSNKQGLSEDDEGYYEYEEIEGDQVLNDLRSVKPRVSRGTATYWHDVDLPKLQSLYPATYARVRRLGDWPHEIPRAWNSLMQQVGTKA